MKSLFTSSKKYVIIESPSKKLMYGTKRAARGDIMVKKDIYKIKRYKLTSIFYKSNYKKIKSYIKIKGAQKWLLQMSMETKKYI